MSVFATEELSVRFRQTEALRGLSVQFGSGVCGVLGPNGAGKTTLLRVLTGSLAPTSGTVSVAGKPCRTGRDRSRLQTQIGFLPQDPSWFDGFTARELCEYMAALRAVPRRSRRPAAATALESVGLTDHAGERLGDLSGGQRRRAFIAQTLVHEPQILVLDEPTAGLDPEQRIRLRDLIADLGRSRTVLISTHLVEDIAQVADSVIILDSGRLIWNGTPNELARNGEKSGAAARVGISPHELGFLAALHSRSK